MSVEDALYYDERLAEVAAVGVPDDKLGELVAAVVSTKPAFHGRVKESELLELARSKSVDPVSMCARYFNSHTIQTALLCCACIDHHSGQAVR